MKFLMSVDWQEGVFARRWRREGGGEIRGCLPLGLS
jgi:hypothetical protein